MASATCQLFAGLACALLAAATPVWAAEPPGKSLPPRLDLPPEGLFSLSITGEYTTGDYGTTSSTDVWYFPVMLRYQMERAVFRVTVPYLIVEGTGAVVVPPGDQHGGHVTSSTGHYTDSGLGDVIVSGTYELLPERDTTPSVWLTGKIKLATASRSSNLGTGETDYAVEVELVKNRDRITSFVGVGYEILGDPPGINFNDVLYGYIGAEYRFDNLLSGGVVLDAAQAATTAGSELRQLTAYLVRKIDKTVSARGYLILGLADGSPDWGFGVGVIYYWR
jgi:hypothetical protein